ncbi:hypothetical protein QOT17_004214 [Balamuthia mandrillaris]
MSMPSTEPPRKKPCTFFIQVVEGRNMSDSKGSSRGTLGAKRRQLFCHVTLETKKTNEVLYSSTTKKLPKRSHPLWEEEMQFILPEGRKPSSLMLRLRCYAQTPVRNTCKGEILLALSKLKDTVDEWFSLGPPEGTLKKAKTCKGEIHLRLELASASPSMRNKQSTTEAQRQRALYRHSMDQVPSNIRKMLSSPSSTSSILSNPPSFSESLNRLDKHNDLFSYHSDSERQRQEARRSPQQERERDRKRKSDDESKGSTSDDRPSLLTARQDIFQRFPTEMDMTDMLTMTYNKEEGSGEGSRRSRRAGKGRDSPIGSNIYSFMNTTQQQTEGWIGEIKRGIEGGMASTERWKQDHYRISTAEARSWMETPLAHGTWRERKEDALRQREELQRTMDDEMEELRAKVNFFSDYGPKYFYLGEDFDERLRIMIEELGEYNESRDKKRRTSVERVVTPSQAVDNMLAALPPAASSASASPGEGEKGDGDGRNTARRRAKGNRREAKEEADKAVASSPAAARPSSSPLAPIVMVLVVMLLLYIVNKIM